MLLPTWVSLEVGESIWKSSELGDGKECIVPCVVTRMPHNTCVMTSLCIGHPDFCTCLKTSSIYLQHLCDVITHMSLWHHYLLWMLLNMHWLGKTQDNKSRLLLKVNFILKLTMEAKTSYEGKQSHVLTFPSKQSSVEFPKLRRMGLFLAGNTPWAAKQITNAKRAFTSKPKITPAWSAWLLDSGAMAIILLHVWVSLLWSTFNLPHSLSLFKYVAFVLISIISKATRSLLCWR